MKRQLPRRALPSQVVRPYVRVPLARGPASLGAAVPLSHPGSSTFRLPRVHLAPLLAFVKPHIDVTFVAVGVTGTLLAWHGTGSLPVPSLTLVVGSVALLSAGAECWTNMHDRDIDALMPRTARRPLVTGQISLRQAALLGATCTAGGLALAAALGPIPLLFLAAALINNVVVYSMITKRATPWSIVMGSVVVPFTLWAGYAAVRVPIPPAVWLLGAMTGVWVFVHIWVIAIRYRDDYALARVPMAPLVWSRVQVTWALAASASAMGALAVGAVLDLGGPAGRWAAVPVGLASVIILGGAVFVPSRERLAGPLVHLITVYLVLVLGVGIGCALSVTPPRSAGPKLSCNTRAQACPRSARLEETTRR